METKLTKQQYFVVLWQEELEMLKTVAQESVYRSIKSFTANGHKSVGLSLRDIASRCRLSPRRIKDIVPQVCELGWIKVIGQENRRGGKVNVFKCEVATHLTNESVKSFPESVKSIGTKLPQSNKVNSITTRSADRVKKASRETDPNFQVISKSLLSYMFEKTGVKQILIPKQLAAIRRILNAGYEEKDARWAIDKLLLDPYWKSKGFDFMTIAGQLPKLKMSKPKTLEEQGFFHYKAKGGSQ